MPTLKHIVFWQLQDFAQGANKATNLALMREKLLSCENLVPGMLKLEVASAREAHENQIEATCDLVLLSEFTDKKALLAYQKHPTHQAHKNFIAAVTQTRQCMDFIS